ncbi:putative glycerol kinase 5 [Clonorchis sinensis]|uniref:Glycerol kinase 5 n=1 Tax=Clonorchis sinensis TaxID=79923 RepID=A0A3R7JGL2_CLOSI|nr:putative glycerol kinase 5 [Clonorchis sinensis]
MVGAFPVFKLGSLALKQRMAQLILGVDFGSTHACARLYSQDLKVVACSSCRVVRIEADDGTCELDPEGVWTCLCQVIKDALSNAGATPEDVKCVGISVQRNSLLLWDKDTSKPRTNVITWQDLRASNVTKRWNNSLVLRSMKAGGHVLYWMTRLPRFKALASYRFKTILACIRLKHVLDERPLLLAECRRGSVYYGCLETWFLWRLTGGEAFCTDVSCASVSGMYDPFTRRWSGPILCALGIPSEILPEVFPSSHLYGYVRHGPLKVPSDAAPVAVTALIGDAQAATLTEDCLGLGQAKLTLGTGSFLNMSTGNKAYALMNGFYPVIGWASSCPSADTMSAVDVSSCGSSPCASSHSSDLTYLLEGSHPNTGTIIEWLRTEHVFDTYAELEQLLEQGDQLGLDDEAKTANTFYVNVPPNHLRRHQEFLEYSETIKRRKFIGPDGVLVGINESSPELNRIITARAVMESIAFTIRQMLEQCSKEAGLTARELRVNGNVSLSDWLMQRLADTTGIPIERSGFEESSCLGAAIAAGVGAGVWSSFAAATQMLHHRMNTESGRFRSSSQVNWTLCRHFQPRPDIVQRLRGRYRRWCQARRRYIRQLRSARIVGFTDHHCTSPQTNTSVPGLTPPNTTCRIVF